MIKILKANRLLAPALYEAINQPWKYGVSHNVYASLEDAKKDFPIELKVFWPAIKNAQGFYEVPNE